MIINKTDRSYWVKEVKRVTVCSTVNHLGGYDSYMDEPTFEDIVCGAQIVEIMDHE